MYKNTYKFDMKESDIILQATESKLNFYVTSYGGCGSNYVKRLLGEKYKITNIWNKKICHYIRPLDIYSAVGCLYIYRHPICALMSQWNRGICGNFFKIRDETNANLLFSFENLFFLMYEQMKNFKNNNLSYFTILIKYETAYKYKNELEEILNIRFDFKKNNTKNHTKFINQKNIDVTGKYFNKLINLYNDMPEFELKDA
jgi:hypothetical protein